MHLRPDRWHPSRTKFQIGDGERHSSDPKPYTPPLTLTSFYPFIYIDMWTQWTATKTRAIRTARYARSADAERCISNRIPRFFPFSPFAHFLTSSDTPQLLTPGQVAPRPRLARGRAQNGVRTGAGAANFQHQAWLRRGGGTVARRRRQSLRRREQLWSHRFSKARFRPREYWKTWNRAHCDRCCSC